jgi:multiple sugar transport system permease protein
MTGSLPANPVAPGAIRRPSSILRRLDPEARGAWFVTPAMLLILFILIAPAIYGVYFSLFQIKHLQATDLIWLENYEYLFTDPQFVEVLWRSFIFAVFTVGLTMMIGLAVAVLVNRLTGMLSLVVQILIVLPWVISHVVGALLFKWVFVIDLGFGRYMMEQLGFQNYQPLSEPDQAMVVLVIYSIWRSLGFAMLLLLAGLKSIPADLYEAAHVDGASAWQRFTRITLPMLKTPLLITLVILTVSNLNNVEGPLVVTGGGPAGSTTILPLDLYIRAFARFDYSTGLALGISMFAANILLALGYVSLVKRNG